MAEGNRINLKSVFWIREYPADGAPRCGASFINENFGFNAPGTLSYVLRTFDGKEEFRTVEVPNNYCLEVEQLGRCITGEETPYVTGKFSMDLADTVDRILETSGYGR